MSPFRVLQFSIVILMLFSSTWLVRMVGLVASPTDTSTSTWLSGPAALAGVLADNGGDNGGGDNGGDNSGGDNGGGDNGGNSNNNSNSNGNSNGNGNDNFDLNLPPLPSSREPERPPEPTCSTPGQDTVFTSRDNKMQVRVFPNSPPIRIEIYQVIDFLSAPLPPGNLVGLLAYEIRAANCDNLSTPLAHLPAEANMSVRYTDLEATGLDKSRFVIGHLDMPTATWIPVEKRGNDPANNYTAATIVDTGFYMVWETR